MAAFWPMDKMLRSLEARLKSGTTAPKGFAVVLTTGGMNPAHRGHVQLLKQAAKRLEEAGYGVVGAWLSPSHDRYLQPKAQSLGTIGLSAPFRLALASEAVNADDFVSIGWWEADEQHRRWPDFPVVADALREHLKEQAKVGQLAELLPKESVSVFYACGADHAGKCGLYDGMSGCGVVVVPRTGERVGKENEAKSVYVAEACMESAAFSSTKVRQAIAYENSAYLSEALSPAAARFLLQPTTAEKTKYVADYGKLQAF
eukprot:TRINITY_DN4108_c0_g1_i1.p1 TRINITY_DN4108_c0_g1~~TRINITY_DN4108_c0_g1_i1.p1  ORF type:complete len:278 (-),score=43.90 TRINITY_DN4108_c0_g1_i1:350-1126(-)